MTSNAPFPLILTRPEPASTCLIDRLPDTVRDLVAPIVSPLLRIVPLGLDAAPGLRDAAIFTSAQGVRHSPAGQGRAAFCVGTQTAQAAQMAGWDVRETTQTADQLVATMLRLRPRTPLWHLAGTHTRGDVAPRLTQAGLSVRYVPVYDQCAQPLTNAAKAALRSGLPSIVPLFSPRTAQILARQAETLQTAHIVALSAAVWEAIGKLPVASVDIAVEPDRDAMQTALEKRVLSLGPG